MKAIPISDLRSNLKLVLDLVKGGQAIDITQRGQVIATICPPRVENDHAAFLSRLDSYKNGGIALYDDIVNAPLKDQDYVTDIDFDDIHIAAEPHE